MKKIKKLVLGLALIVPSLLCFSACGIDDSGGSLLSSQVYVSTETLNGGKFSSTINKDNSNTFKQYMGLKPETFDKNNYHLLNNYHVEYAYEMTAEPNDVIRDGYKFGGWYLDKECTNGNYLTKNTYTKRYNEEMSKDKKSIPLYARWLKPGERELVFEVNDNFTFKGQTPVNNQIRLTFTEDQYNSASKLNNIISSFPEVSITDVGKTANGNQNQFKKWKVDFNGLRYDYKDLKYLTLINTYSDAFMTVPYHNFSYDNFFRSGVDKPYALLRPELMPIPTEVSFDVFFNENGGKWNPNYGKDCDRIIDKYSGIGVRSFEYSIYNFVNHGISSKQRQMITGGKYIDIDYLPNVNDITKEGKVFAGWYLDKECSPNKYFCQKTWEEIVIPKVSQLSYELDLYARWIDVGQREILFADENGIRRIEFTKTNNEEIINKNPLTNYKVDFNGLLFDYSTGEYTFVPKTVTEGKDFDTIYKKPIEAKYYEYFNYENFINNGDAKPYALVVKTK